MNKIVAFCFLGLLFATTAPAHAKESWEHDPVMLSKDAIDINHIIAPPPESGSEKDQSDVQELLSSQKKRTPADCERATSEISVNLNNFFGPKYGPLTAKEVEAWNPFFLKVKDEAEYFIQNVKRKWNRPRPYVKHHEITPCVRLEGTAAYPSGHAALSRIFSRVLEKLDPKQSQAIETRAQEIGRDRVLGGVHHPSDIEAGYKLGDAVYDALSKNPKFEAELNTILLHHAH